jgi:hypothetical protein
MLLWDKPEVLEGLTVYRDERDWTSYYVLPSQPRYRIDDNGDPVFKFLKYRNPIEREGGKKGGGFLIFDVEFVVPTDKEVKIRELLQERINASWRARNMPGTPPPVKIAQWNVTRAKSTIQFLDSGGAMVEKIQNPGSPSLYGKFITPFTVELSPEGATLAEAALQDRGGVVQVAYDLFVPVKLPPITARVWFRAEKVMEFHQSINADERFWGADTYKEKIEESFTQSEAGGVSIDPGAVTDQKIIGAVRDWAWNSLEQAVTRMVLGETAAQDPAVAQKMYSEMDFEKVQRDVKSSRVASFSRTYREGMVMEWNPAPRGTLPNITSLTNKDGKPIKWSDFARQVDLNDPFFRTLNVNVRANADFTSLPIDSIEVKLHYKQGTENTIREYSLRNGEQIEKFASFVANDSYKYKYSYQVNYKNASQRYESPEVETEERQLTINVGDTGILLLNVEAGDLNFEQVKEAQVTLRYEDSSSSIAAMEQVYRLDKDRRSHRWVQTIFKPRTQPVSYKVKYFMADGREFVSAEQKTLAQQVFINDPFSASRTINVRGFGDFDARIDSIFVDLEYHDQTNDYQQSSSGALTKGSTFMDWTFPVISETGGVLAYSGNIRFKDGSVTPIPRTETTGPTIMLGDVQLSQSVEVLADLIDFDLVRLVKVSLSYRDEQAGIENTGNLVFKKGAPTTSNWIYPFKDKTKKKFTWSASYFKADGSVANAAPVETTDTTLVLPSMPS